MNGWAHLTKRMEPGFRILALLALVVTGWLGAFVPAAAQGGTSDVAIVATENGNSVYDTCFVLVGYSNEGCDQNQDGKITFQDVPLGTYTVTQTRNLGSGRYVPDTTIRVTGAVGSDGWEHFYLTVVNSGGSSSGSGGTSDVAVVATQNGQPVYDACFVLVGYSNEGCDENRDGKITFDDVPVGSYTLRQTRDLGAGRSVPDSTIRVTGRADNDGWERFYVSVNGSSQGSLVPMDIGATGPNGHVIGARFTVTTMDGTYLGSCTLEGHGQEPYPLSCQVPVPRGGTVVVTLDLGSIPPGMAPVENPVYFDTMRTTPGMASHWGTGFDIQPTGGSGGQSGAVDIALITRAPEDGRLLTGTCYVLVGYSNVGCDENGDGQVTFADVEYGTYTVRQTQTPSGFPTINDFDINVWPLGNLPGGGMLDIPLGFIVRQAPEQNAPDTRNVSVLLLDAITGEKLVGTGACVELVGASNVGCDEDLVDGQIDFLDVPAGGPYELRFSSIPAGWQVGTDGQPYTVSIYPEPDSPSYLFAFVLLNPISSTSGTSMQR